MHQIPLYDQMVVEKLSVVFYQSFISWRLVADGFQWSAINLFFLQCIIILCVELLNHITE